VQPAQGERVPLHGALSFHQETTASFTVHATHQFISAFSCGVKGESEFHYEREANSFLRSLKSLAERYMGSPIQALQYADEDSRLR